MSEEQASLSDGLERTVQAAIQAGRIGRPSAIRWLVRYRAAGDAAAALARARQATTLWFGGAPQGRHSASDESSRHVVETLTWSTGQVAVISATPGGRNAADDLVVLGSRGALYYETPMLHLPEEV